MKAWPKWLCLNALIFAGTVWGGSFVFAKIATEELPAFGLTFWLSAFGAIILIGVQCIRRRRIPYSRSNIIFYVVCGFLGTALPSTIYFLAVPHLQAGVISITVATVPMLTFLLALAMRYDKFSLLRLSGVMLGAAAIVLLIGPETSLPNPSMAPWVAFSLIGSFAYAAENMVIATRMPKGLDAITVLTGMQIATAAMMLPLALATDEFFLTPFEPWGPAEWSILTMAVINVVAYTLFVALINQAGPVYASQMGYVVTASGVVWGIAVFGEGHSAWVWAALVVMMTGLALVKPREADDSKETEA